MSEYLFEMEVTRKPGEDHAGAGRVCRECAACVRPHLYRTDWCYCEVMPCKRTQFGIAKIKAMRPACSSFVALPFFGYEYGCEPCCHCTEAKDNSACERGKKHRYKNCGETCDLGVDT